MPRIVVILIFLITFQAIANTSDPQYICVKGFKARLRDLPDTNSQVIKTVDKFTPLKILETKQDWFKVSDKMDATAWVHHSVLSKKINCVQALNQGATRVSKAITSIPLEKKPEVYVNETFKIIMNSESSLKVEDIHGHKFWLDSYSVWPKSKSEMKIQL